MSFASKVYLKLRIGALSIILFFSVIHSVLSAPAQTPLFLAQPVRPVMMLNMSNDHQLFFKAYDDYSDLDKDGTPDIGYKNAYQYYGYFDSEKCYLYTNGRFEPNSFAVAGNPATVGKYCNNGTTNNEWSGNFLNWATMTRVDAVRKILYGGLRSTDSLTETVLERAFLPNDAHSFAKYYAGADLPNLTPFGAASAATDVKDRGLTICNTTDPSDRNVRSQSVTSPPLMRVARGNFSLWASNERWQCRWRDNVSDSNRGVNGNNPEVSGIQAYSDSPKLEKKLGDGDYNVRVKVCVTGHTNDTDNESCRTYIDNNGVARIKPSGLLQQFGENNSIHFGLMTGSYAKNKSGGVLRKNAGTITNEINLENGIFVRPADEDVTTFNGIIRTLDVLRIYGYNYNGAGEDGAYNDSGADNCPWALNTFNNDRCSNWGNPQSEIFLESLRYLAGKATANFSADDSSRIAGLNTASWAAPISNNNYCAPLSVIQFNASTSSYDSGSEAELGGVTDVGLADVAALNTITDSVGTSEGISGTTRFVGRINGSTEAADIDGLCTAKTVNNLSSVGGTCPDAPRLNGGYQIAGLAYHARKDGILLDGVSSGNNRQKVTTYGVALAPAVPRVEVKVPGSETQKITLLPACRNNTVSGNCAIVDFKIVDQQFNVTTASGATANTGKLYVNWEDSEQGGDFDQDMWGIINYVVTGTQVTVTTDVVAQSTPDRMGFGYVISGTTSDGFYTHSGINGYTRAAPDEEDIPIGAKILGCSSCNSADSATSNTFNVGTSSAKPLEQPLYYAAKWGGYSDDGMTTTQIAAVTNPPNYFFATDPRTLKTSLENAFRQVSEGVGGAATVAANSTRLDGDTLVYQARFDSSDWSGEMLAYPVTANGTVNTAQPKWTTNTMMPVNADSRRIFTYDGTANTTVELTTANWSANLLPSLKAALQSDGADDSIATNRFNWLRGDRANESAAGGLRIRTKLLGDIVNSDPAFSGANDMRYGDLPAEYGAASYAAYVQAKRARTPLIFVGANDGMLHAFNANTGAEVFAYIPRGVFANLTELTKPNYQHRYYVDGPMFVGDAYFDNDSDGVGGTWKTILVGTLGAGGRGIFALDITNPLAPEVIFDIHAGDGSTLAGQLGYISGQALLVPTGASNRGDGVWSVIVGNGYESTSGRSKLIAIDIEDPTNVVAIDTETGTGLSAPALLPDNTGVVTAAYAGDLTGRMWRFDLTGNNLTAWDSFFNGAGAPRPFFRAINDSGGAQPITAAPTLGYNSLKTKNGGAPSVMVYFGTGKYYESADNLTKGIQSFYGIADTDNRVTITTATKNTVLHEKVITAETTTRRTIANDATPESGETTVDWDSKSGWYIDLVTPPGLVGTGERVVSKPRLLYDRLLFTSFIPSSLPCQFGGSGWLMELTGVGDKYIGHSILGDEANTPLIYGVLGSGGLTPITGGEKVTIPICDIKGDCDSIIGLLPAAAKGRMSWRQVR